jgi:hypothetical protein
MKVLAPGVYKVFAPGVYDIAIVPEGSPFIIYNSEAFVVKSPEIYSIYQGEGTAWDQITIDGRFFGTKRGKIYLEYNGDGGLKRKKCKVSNWMMDSTTGEGEIIFGVPPTLPEVYDVVVDPYGTLPEIEEEDGFTVMAPEIVSVSPSVGTSGGEITIHGYYFGTKKPKVYLGYNMDGKPKKKSCAVVRWTVVDSSTGEGDIVCKAPTGLPEGIYDVIVTNSVGSDAELGIFTFHTVH